MTAALLRRPGPVLLVPAWLLLGVCVVLYAVAIALFALLMVLTATLRLFLTPVSRATGGLWKTGSRARPGA